LKAFRLRNKFANSFIELNKKRHEFNLLNEDFFKYYNRVNFLSKYFLRRQVILLEESNKLVGYMWYSKIDQGKNNYLINALYVEKEYMDLKCKTLFNLFKRDSNFYFDGKVSKNTADFIEELGFFKKNGTYEMSFLLNNLMHEPLMDKVEFIPFQKGKYEKLRCDLQNEIFFEKDRRPLTVKDIIIDEMQDYFVEDWCIFVKYEKQFVGYGQIIITDSWPLIVNFGILEAYRRKGLANALLNHLLNILYNSGYKKVKIKVDISNTAAYMLYEKKGFVKDDVYFTWQYVKKDEL